jgi:streptogramin lyase
MNRTHEHGDLPDPIRSYWIDLRRTDPPMELLDEVVAELEKAPRPLRFSFVPVAGLMAAAAILIAVTIFNLWPGLQRSVGDDETTRPATIEPTASAPPSYAPGVVPIREDPPLESVPTLDAEIVERDVEVTGWPVLAAYGSVWFGDIEKGQLSRVDTATGAVTAVIDVNPDPATDRWDQLAMADDRWVYAVGLDETLVRIDPATNEIVERIPIGTVPYRMEIHDGSAYITDLDYGRVTRVDLTTDEVIWQVRVGSRPGGIEITGGAVWVTSYADAVLHRLDPQTGEVVEEYRAYVNGMDIVHDGGDVLYITGNQDRPMERFSISEGRVTARIEEMGGPVILDGRLYGTRWPGQLLVRLDPATLEWEAARAMGTLEAGMVEGEGAVWIYEPGRLLEVHPGP